MAKNVLVRAEALASDVDTDERWVRVGDSSDVFVAVDDVIDLDNLPEEAVEAGMKAYFGVREIGETLVPYFHRAFATFIRALLPECERCEDIGTVRVEGAQLENTWELCPECEAEPRPVCGEGE